MKKMLLTVAAAAFSATGANAALVYGVDEFNNLVSFNSAAPTSYVSSTAITGLGDSLQALDFRPINNVLYGLGGDNTIYTINTATGAATAVSGALALTGTSFAFDFNPTIDRLRIVSNTNDNYVFNPNDGSLTQATDVFYPGSATDPDIVGAAYTTAQFGDPATSTQLYSIDSRNDLLVRQANSAGTLTRVGALGANFGTRTSFDIAGNDAFAQNGRNFYGIDLQTGAATLIGRTDNTLFGIAVAVPEPATWAMMIGGIGAAGGMLRRRRVTTRVRFA